MKVSCITLFVVVLLLSAGCVVRSSQVERGVPLDEQAIEGIVIGETTRSEIFRRFGTPHSMFTGQVESVTGGSTGYFSYVESRWLSSIDDDKLALLYRFGTTESKDTLAVAVVVTLEERVAKIRSNELLILIDRKTELVSDVAYRKEID